MDPTLCSENRIWLYPSNSSEKIRGEQCTLLSVGQPLGATTASDVFRVSADFVGPGVGTSIFFFIWTGTSSSVSFIRGICSLA